MREALPALPANLNATVAFELLKRVDVRDAMSFSIATGNDPQVAMISHVMQHDDIWQYWFERDLKVIMDELDGSDWLVAHENVLVDSPKWKVLYLWGRLLISNMQFGFFRSWEPNLVHIYPPNSVIEFNYLNTFTVIVDGDRFSNEEVLHMDFREQWDRFVMKLNPRYYLVNLYNFETLVDYIPEPTDYRLLADKYHMVQADAEKYTNALTALYRWISGYKSTLKCHIGALSSIPRLIEKAKILVANRMCSNCESTSNVGYRCGDCFVEPTFYCSSKCQDADWETHVCKQ